MLGGEWEDRVALLMLNPSQPDTRYACNGRTELSSGPPSRLDDALLARRLIARGAIICRRCVEVKRA